MEQALGSNRHCLTGDSEAEYVDENANYEEKNGEYASESNEDDTRDVAADNDTLPEPGSALLDTVRDNWDRHPWPVNVPLQDDTEALDIKFEDMMEEIVASVRLDTVYCCTIVNTQLLHYYTARHWARELARYTNPAVRALLLQEKPPTNDDFAASEWSDTRDWGVYHCFLQPHDPKRHSHTYVGSATAVAGGLKHRVGMRKNLPPDVLRDRE